MRSYSLLIPQISYALYSTRYTHSLHRQAVARKQRNQPIVDLTTYITCAYTILSIFQKSLVYEPISCYHAGTKKVACQAMCI